VGQEEVMPDVADLQKARLHSIAIHGEYFSAAGKPSPEYFSCRSCPVCSLSGENRIIYQNDSGADFVQCGSCVMIFMNPALKREHVEDIYLRSREKTAKNQQWKKLIKKLRPAEQVVVSDRYELLLKYSKRGRLLDFGCGFGKLTDKLKFFFDSIEGLEIDEFCAQQAESIFGFKVHNDFIANLNLENRFDAVISYNNIEHLYEPKKELEYINKSLKKGGIIYIECPNIDSLSVKLFKGKHHLLQSNEHLNMFSKKTISDILERNGYDILELRTRKLDIQLNDLLVWIFRRNIFFHRCSSHFINNSFINEKIVKNIDTLVNLIFNKINNIIFCKGAYIQVIARKL
jgi:2-polyprenyl-3-methyl-5-hydroxy-6-metoxy-1,4-benzoquinol methylase